VPLCVLLLLPCLLLWPVVFGGAVFLPADLLHDIAPWRTTDPKTLTPWNPLHWDGIAEFYPWRLFAAQTLRAGFLPLWNPHQFCGTPFVANSQSAVFYPLNLLFCVMPVARAFGVSVLLHLWLTGFFQYRFLRSSALGLGRAAALLGAVAWQMCHWQVTWLELPTFLCVSAWLPLALLLVDRAANRPTPARAVPLGLVLGLMLLAGHLQIALYCFGLVGAYALFRLRALWRAQWPALAGCAGLALALAFGVAAPQLLPAVELSRFSHRAGGAVTGAAYAGYVRLALPPADLVTLFLPGFYGNPTRGTFWGIGTNGGPGAYIENACYGGVLPLLLALVAVFGTWRTRAETRFFVGAALAVLLLALGTPLNALPFFGLPGFAQTGSPGRILVLWSFCVSVLAAVGAQRVLKSAPWAALARAAGAYALLALGAAGFAVLWISANAPAGTLAAHGGDLGDGLRVLLGILLAFGAALWFRQRGSLKTPALGGLMAALAALDLLGAGLGFNRTARPAEVYPVTPTIAWLQAHRDEGRVIPINTRWPLGEPPPAVLPPNAAMVYGLYDTQGYDSLQTKQYFEFAGRVDNGSPAPPQNGNMVFTNGYGTPEARAASARFVVSREPLTHEGFVLRFQDNGVFVYEDAGALSRVRANKTGESFRLQEAAPSRVMLEGGGDKDFSEITLGDQWYPGWKAKFDDLPVAVAQGPMVFRTITLTPRMQEISREKVFVEMRYEPMAFRVGLYLLCLALGTAAAFGAAAGTAMLRRRRG